MSKLSATVFLGLASSVRAVNWAVLAAGSKTYDNYRHQADICRAYQLLLSKGFHEDRIITMAYDDIASHPENPFPGKIFNQPDPTGPGEDVYEGCRLDYTGDAVSAANFAAVLAGNSTSGGNGKVLKSSADDNVFIFYVDHGAPGVLEFPNDELLHVEDFQALLLQMQARKMFKSMVIYIEACESGSMLEGLPTDLGIYGVTAVGPDTPSLGTYCGYDAVVNGTKLNTCLGDLFAVMFMQFIESDDGSSSMQLLFDNVFDKVASYAALHYGRELNMQYGDLSIASLPTKEFFYPEDGDVTLRQASKPPKWHLPGGVYSAPRLSMDRLTHMYSDVAAKPTYAGKKHFSSLKQLSKRLKDKVAEQEATQQVYWSLVEHAVSEQEQEAVWTQRAKPLNKECELRGHEALARECHADMTSSYSLQFHQVLVNLCSREDLAWAGDPRLAVQTIEAVCSTNTVLV
jgi:legumain